MTSRAASAICLHCIVFAVGSPSHAGAQVPLVTGSPAQQQVVRYFEDDLARSKAPTLQCSLHQIRPRIAFNFRFFTGFFASLPAKQFTGDENSIAMAIRVTPQGGEPSYFAYASALPPIPKDVGRTYLEFSGGVYTGEGKYKVDITLHDRTERVCTASWTATAQDRKIPVQQAANTVAPLGADTWKGLNARATGGRVTVFVHAIPLYYRRALSKLGAFDRLTLLGSLTSLLDQSKFSKARVVVFDLLGKRVLFRQENFDPAGYKRLVDVLERADYGTVDVKTLQQGGSDSAVVRNLLREEMNAKDKSDAVVFLGAEGRPSQRAGADLREYGLPSAFYMGFTRFQRPMEDAMYQAVRSMKGKIVTVYRPVDLAKGIKSLVQTANSGGGSP